jgi:hypothetical protein
VVWPGVGAAVVEVKGGLVWTRGGEWFSTRADGRVFDIKNPIEQARKARWALDSYLRHRGYVPSDHHFPAVPVAVLPRTRRPPGFRPPGAEPEQFLFRHDVTDPATFGAALTAAIQSAPHAGISPLALGLDLDAITDVLTVTLPPPPLNDVIGAHEDVVDLLTHDQYDLLRRLRLNDRVLIRGGAGTGKTWLALLHAREETRRGGRVALVCYNRGLALMLERTTRRWPADERPAFVGTVHALATQWALRGREPRQDELDALPELLTHAAADVPADEHFDVLVVDEGQDMRSAWWPGLLATLTDPESGPVVLFQDELQSVFVDGGEAPFQGVLLDLDENLRNTQEIAAGFHPFHGRPYRARGPSGPAVQFIDVPVEEADARADAEVARLLSEERVDPAAIAVLTTFRRHPRHAEAVSGERWRTYWDAFFADEVFYSTVKGFKGLERPIVVLTVNGFHPDDSARDLLHVGMSRARSVLIVVGDRALVERAAQLPG